MLRFCRIILIALIIMPLSLLSEYTPREAIIKTSQFCELSRTGTGLIGLDSFLAERNCISIETLGNSSRGNYLVVKFAEDLDWEEISQLDFEGVLHIQPNYLNEFHVTPNDPLLYEQSMDIINASTAWNLTTGSKNIIVGIIDSGVHYDHPDLQENIYINDDEIPEELFDDIDQDENGIISNIELMQYFEEHDFDIDQDGEITHADLVSEGSVLVNNIDDDSNGYTDDIMGWDFTDASELANIASGDYLDQDNYPEDEYNHGTHVSGVIGATANNGLGISGVCWEVNLLNIRAGFKTADGLSGVLQDDDAAAGIIYAADMGADVINLSWGDYVNSPVISDACHYAYQQGSVIVVSAGNTASEGLMYPARLSNTISVGAVDAQRERFWQSSYGSQLDIMAPGVNVMSCFDVTESLYEQMSGTSMSAPYVSGAVALLLSREPQLDFDSVRSRLSLSAIDLGESSLDPYYGYGLLDLSELLHSVDDPCIEILYPADNQGISNDFAVMGSVHADNFSKYSVMFSNTLQPESGDWKSVEAPHSMSPSWQTEPVINGQLAWFDIPANDGEYLMKVELVTTDNQHYSFPWSIAIDQSEPEINSQYTGLQYRYEGENLVNYLVLSYNEKVDIEATLSSSTGNEFTIYSSNMDSLHYLRIPLLTEPGTYDAEIISSNICGLTSIDQCSDLQIRQNCLEYNSWESQTLGEALVCIPKPFAYEEDGVVNELIGMYISDSMQRQIYVLEADGYGLNQRFQINGLSENFWPHSWGNLSGGSFELVGVEANTAVLYYVDGNTAQSTWSLNNSYGGSFIDYDNDGVDDLALVQNVTIGNVTYRVLGLHKKFGSTWQTMQLIYNETETYSKNEFLNCIECSDLDGDGKMDILTADNDGDIIIYEYDTSTSVCSQVWHERLPLQNADYIAMGNFTGDNTKEFCAGVWHYDSGNSANTFSWFAIFGFAGVDNSYELLDTVIFDEYRENMGVCIADTDHDDYEELIIAADPYIYIIDHVDTNGDDIADSFLPVWQGDSNQHYPKTICAVSATSSSSSQIITNRIDQSQRNSVCYFPAGEFNGPGSVSGFQVTVTGADSAELSWLEQPDAECYRIYRKETSEDDQQEIMIIETAELIYNDSSLIENTEYSYRIKAYNSLLFPPEGLPTYWQNIKTSAPPQLVEEIKMVSPWNLEIIFDQVMDNSAANTGHYQVNNNIGRPASVNLTHQKQGVLLTFNQQFVESDNYSIEIKGIITETGVSFTDGIYGFSWQNDSYPPQILECQVLNKQLIKVIFNEPIEAEEKIENYLLDLPEADPENYFTEVSAEYDHVLLELAKPITPSNQMYYLKVDKVCDLAGNYINSLGNKTQFALTNSSLENMITYPNPFYTEKYSEFRFASLPEGKNGELWIYDLSGELVYQSSIEPRTQLDNYFSWSGKNSSGKKVSSGLYFYILQIGTELQKGKIAVVN